MKKIITLLITFFFYLSVQSQTVEQVIEWLNQSLAISVQYDSIHYDDDESESTHYMYLAKYSLEDLYDYEFEDSLEYELLRDQSIIVSLDILTNFYSNIADHYNAIKFGTLYMEFVRSALGVDHYKYVLSLETLAYNYTALGDYSKAVELLTQAMDILISKDGSMDDDYVSCLSALSVDYAYLGDYSKAVELGTKAVEIRRSFLDDPDDITHILPLSDYATSLNNLAGYYSNLGDYIKAVELGTQALEIEQSVLFERNPDIAISLTNLASYYAALGDYSKAVDLCTQASEIFLSFHSEKHPDYAFSLDNLATFYSDLGNYSKAVELCTMAMEIKRSVLGEQHPRYAISLNNLANYYFRLGNHSKALDLSTQAMEIFHFALGERHPRYALSLNNIAFINSTFGDHVKAVEIGKKAMEILRSVLGEQHPDYAVSLRNLVYDYYSLGDYSRALHCFSQSISILQNNTLQLFANLTASQRNLLWAKNSYEFTDAYPYFIFQSNTKTAPDLYDKSALFAKGLLLSTEIEMNRLIQESDDEEALRMFNELQINRLQLQKLFETPIAERHINTDSLEQIVDRQEQALVRRSAVYGDFTRKLRTTWQDVQKALQPDEIAIEFLSFNVLRTDSTMVAALTLRKDDKEPKFIPLFEQQQLLGVSDPSYYHCPELTALVWRPLQQELQGIKRIYFSPAGALHNIGIEYAPGMEEYEMYRLSSTREVITHAETHPGPPKGREMAALYGGIDYNASLNDVTSFSGEQDETSDSSTRSVSISLHRTFVDSLDLRGMKANYLPATLTEVKNIKSSFDRKNNPSVLTTGKEATETSAKTISGKAPLILHIATHGFYFSKKQADSHKDLRFLSVDDSFSGAGRADSEDKSLTRSGLLFAGANNALRGQDIPMGEDDGILTAQEISRMDLRGVDLVVLSACKTGNGDINQGEGVFGLQRGFKKAGVQTLVMSLWEVADDATQILMTAFYDNLLQGQSKRDALHNAQHHLRIVDGGQYDHPQFWAAFIILD